jgi:hypothetical protein
MVPGLLIERAGAVRSAPGKSCRKFGRPAKLTAEQAAFARRLKANGETAYAGPLASSATVGSTERRLLAGTQPQVRPRDARTAV